MSIKPKPKCRHRARKIAWCNLLKKWCDPPSEYETCKSYEARNKHHFQPFAHGKQRNGLRP